MLSHLKTANFQKQRILSVYLCVCHKNPDLGSTSLSHNLIALAGTRSRRRMIEWRWGFICVLRSHALSAPWPQKPKSRCPKGFQLEVGARRVHIFLHRYSNISMCCTFELPISPSSKHNHFPSPYIYHLCATKRWCIYGRGTWGENWSCLCL